MKFALSTFACAFFVGSALAQSIVIASPAEGTTVKAGSNITVEIDLPAFQSSSVQVALVLAVVSCNDGPCTPPSEFLGDILYNGPYNPQHHPTDPPTKFPYQNFTVTIPSFFEAGTAQISAYHVALVGAQNEPFTEFRNTTLVVE